MIRNLLNRLEDLPRNERGTSLVAYAMLLGGIAVVLVGGLANLSDGVTTALSNEADHIATIAGASTGSGSSSTNPSNPTPSSPTASNPSSPTPSSPTASNPTNPTPSTPTSGNSGNKGGKSKGKGKGKGKK